MDSKSLKALLLEAREGIKQKEFATVKRICQDILNVDQRNYNALVFYGYAAQEMQETEEAVAAFNNAISISPSQLLAWQGLRSFYEKETPLVHKQELVDVYHKFLCFYKDDTKKQVDVLYHIGLTLFKELNDYSKAVGYLCDALEITGKELSSDNANLWSTLFVMLSSQPALLEKEFEILGCSFDKVSEGKSSGVHDFQTLQFASLENYFQLLLKEQSYVRIIEDARKMLKFYHGNEFLISVQIHSFISSIIDGAELVPDDLDDIVCLLPEDNPNKAFYVSLLRGTRFFIAGNWIEARDSLLKCVQLRTVSWWEIRLLLCWTLEKFYDGVGLERFAVEGLKCIHPTIKESRQKNITCLFKLSLGKGLLFEGSHSAVERALSVLAEAAEDFNLESQALYCQGIAYLKLTKLDQIDKVLKSLEALDGSDSHRLALDGWLHAERGDFEASKQRLLAAVELLPGNDDWLLQLGNIYIRLLDYSTAHTYYLKAAKRNPCNASAFLKLGHYYRDVTKDFKKSLECYKYAFGLNKHVEEIAITLSDMYQHLNDTEADLALLRTLTDSCAPGSHKWAFLRLGLLLIRRNGTNEAIRAFQCALRADPLDSECWQCLGEVYLMRGSHTNALKAFRRALELNPHLLYCIYQSANIKLSLGFFKEAAAYFNEIAERVPSYMPALKGLGESYLAQAQTYLSHSCSVKALSLCEATLLLLSRAIVKQTNFTCIWKLLGDACTLPGLMPSAIFKMQVPSNLLNDSSLASDVSILDKLQVLKLGERCYLAAIRRSPRNASSWHDFGINAYYQALANSEIKEKVRCLTYSLASMKKAVSIKRESSFHWHALGVIASVPELKKYSLAQHAFIMAVSNDPNNHAAWSNLGVLYLINGNDKLANQTFAISQSLEPAYINSWLGQAIIAENIKHSDAMDLFRHCTYIGNHMEGYLGYASWVCSTLLSTFVHRSGELSTGNKDVIVLASDSLILYTDIVRDNICAYNMLGLLLERQDHLQTAETAFQNAVELLNVASDNEISHVVHCNYARVLRKTGKLKLSVEKASLSGVDFYSQYGRAAAYREMNLLEESSAAYVKAMQLASTDEEKSNLLVAMASMAYVLRGPEEAKSLLFQSFQMKPACVQGLLALSALGLNLGDAALLAAAVDELKPWDQDESFRLDVMNLRVCQAVLQGDVYTARRIYCKAIHLWPADWPVWPLLSRHFLHYSSDIKMAAHCSSAAARLCGPPAFNVLKQLSLCYFVLQLDELGFKMVEHLIHNYPGEMKYHSFFTRSV